MTQRGEVTVGCRLPSGYVLQAYVGGTDYSFRLNGNRVAVGRTADWLIAGGAGFTRGIPEEVWEEWLRFHEDEMIVTNGVVFAHSHEKAVA